MATRRERVVLDLEDNFSTGMMKAAGATALLKRELNDLSGRAVAPAARDLDKVSKSADKAAKDVERVGKSSDGSAKQIDRLSGRMRLLAEAALVLGPALIPIGAAAIPAVMGLAAGFGAVAASAGIAVMAFQGVGDALKALDKYQMEPTAANLETMQQKLDALGPAGQQMVRTLDSLEPSLKQLQESAREGLFPGVEGGISSLMSMLPEVEQIISNIATEMGKLASEAGKGLTGPAFADFFRYIETDAAPTLEAFGHTIGNVAEGFGHLIVAFAPLTRGFTSGMESMSASFAKWADGLSRSDSFRGFVEYIQQTGPQVVDLVGAIGDAFVGIVQAAAPFGHAVLPVLTELAHVVGAIANSSIGGPLFTAAAGLIAFNRAATLFKEGGALAKLPSLAKTAGAGVQTLVGDFKVLSTTAMTAGANTEREMARIADSSKRANMAMASVGKGVSFVAVLTGIGLINEAFNNLRDTIDTSDLNRNLEALARGAQVDDFSKLAQDLYNVGSSFTYAEDKMSDIFTLGIDTSELENAQQEVEKVDQALAGMVESGNAEQAAAAYQQIVKQAADAGVSSKDVAKAFNAYQTALANLGPAAGEAKDATHGLASALTAVDAKVHQARTGALTTAQSFMKFGDSLGNAKVSLRQWLAELRKQAEALQNFTANAQKAARRGLDQGLIKSLQEAGPVGAMRMRQLANATDSELARANRSWRAGQQAIRQYVNTVGGVPTAKATTLSVHDLATMKARAIKSELASIDRNIDIYIRAHTTRLPSVSGMGPQIGSADGSTVPKDGKPYADRYPYLLAPGEEVISNRSGQADRWRPLLKAINAGRLADGGTVRGLANGGTATRLFTAADGVDALNRTAHELSKAQKAHIEQLKKEGEHRKKLLEKELERDQHEVDRDKKRHDAMVQELNDLKQQRAQLMSQTRSQFSTDIFGSGTIDLAQAAKNGTIGGDFMSKLMEWMRTSGIELQPGTKLSDYADQYLQTLSPDQIAALQTQAGLGQLNQDASNADAFQKAIKKAKKHGLSGGLLHYLEASGNLQAAQQFANMSADQIAQYEAAYKNRNYEINQTARMVGDDKYGAAITAQSKAVERSAHILAEAKLEWKETNHALHRLEKHMNHLNHTQDQAPEKTGKAVGRAINGAISQGTRRGN